MVLGAVLAIASIVGCARVCARQCATLILCGLWSRRRCVAGPKAAGGAARSHRMASLVFDDLARDFARASVGAGAALFSMKHDCPRGLYCFVCRHYNASLSAHYILSTTGRQIV